eukprot:scaffold252776_cov30-Prasinocladus_malaysianus.AAC.1
MGCQSCHLFLLGGQSCSESVVIMLALLLLLLKVAGGVLRTSIGKAQAIDGALLLFCPGADGPCLGGPRLQLGHGISKLILQARHALVGQAKVALKVVGPALGVNSGALLLIEGRLSVLDVGLRVSELGREAVNLPLRRRHSILEVFNGPVTTFRLFAQALGLILGCLALADAGFELLSGLGQVSTGVSKLLAHSIHIHLPILQL